MLLDRGTLFTPQIVNGTAELDFALSLAEPHPANMSIDAKLEMFYPDVPSVGSYVFSVLTLIFMLIIAGLMVLAIRLSVFPPRMSLLFDIAHTHLHHSGLSNSLPFSVIQPSSRTDDSSSSRLTSMVTPRPGVTSSPSTHLELHHTSAVSFSSYLSYHEVLTIDSAFHGSEVQFVYGVPGTMPQTFSASAIGLSESMINYW